MKNRTIADCLKPTYENVSREFITHTLYEIMFNKEYPNFNFDFKEKEAIEYITNILKEESEKYESLKSKYQNILKQLKDKNEDNSDRPLMIINDYKRFFELLRKYYEKDIDLYFERTGYSGFPVYERDNCFEQIWLRATAEDFNDPERFLQKQVEIINDKTFDKYNKETPLGKSSKLNNHIICIKNNIARTWDESQKELEIIIYDKKYYDNKELYSRPHYSLPVIRYGIYNNNNKKACIISSVQNKSFEEDKNQDLINDMKNVRNQLNKGKIKKENYKEKVEPNKSLAISIFIDLLNEEGIYDIEVPDIYVLDNEYHRKRGIQLKEDFENRWTNREINQDPKRYQVEKEYVLDNYQKEDMISEIKSERLTNNVKRMLDYYPKASIKSFPGEADNFMHINIPKINTKEEINNETLQEMFTLVKDKNKEINKKINKEINKEKER